jgi:hypothetical protein
MNRSYAHGKSIREQKHAVVMKNMSACLEVHELIVGWIAEVVLADCATVTSGRFNYQTTESREDSWSDQ